MEEEWKQIEGFPKYFVSNMGKVKSCANRKPRILKPGASCGGYLFVNIRNELSIKLVYLHRLVADYFLEDKRDGHRKVVDHINWVVTDNRASNLQILTQQENCLKQNPMKKTSKFRGVHWHKRNKMWLVNKLHNGRQIFIGTFHDEHEATMAFETITDHELDLILKFRAELRALKKRGVNAVSVLKQLGLR
jgi:hypothetical protein